jgi:hypothetical protein
VAGGPGSILAYAAPVTQHPGSASPGRPGSAASDQPVPAAPSGSGELFRERLIAPWWLWLLGLGLAAVLAAEVFLGAPGRPLAVPYLLLLPATVAGLAWLSRIRVRVADGELFVDDAHLPVRHIARVGVLDAAAKRDALGVHADPLAFVVQRPWISEAVLVVLDDPADPTPYWVVSSRRPRQLAEALLAAGVRATPPAGDSRD